MVCIVNGLCFGFGFNGRLTPSLSGLLCRDRRWIGVGIRRALASRCRGHGVRRMFCCRVRKQTKFISALEKRRIAGEGEGVLFCWRMRFRVAPVKE